MTKDTGSAAFFIVIALGGLWITRTFNTMSAVFPILILSLFLIFSIIFLIVSIYKSREQNEKENKIFSKEASITAAALLIYIFLIWLIGFLFASLLFLGVMTWYLQDNYTSGKKRLINAAGSSVVVTVVFFLLFRYVFLVQLPTGIISS